MQSILTLSVEPGVSYIGFDNFTIVFSCYKDLKFGIPIISQPLKTLFSKDDEWISESATYCKRPLLEGFFVNFGLVLHRFLVFLLLTLNW